MLVTHYALWQAKATSDSTLNQNVMVCISYMIALFYSKFSEKNKPYTFLQTYDCCYNYRNPVKFLRKVDRTLIK